MILLYMCYTKRPVRCPKRKKKVDFDSLFQEDSGTDGAESTTPRLTFENAAREKIQEVYVRNAVAGGEISISQQYADMCESYTMQ